MMKTRVIGAGLAGSEASLILAHNGVQVELIEMKPAKKTPAQTLDWPAELVCSNSFRSTKKSNAVALLKEEMKLFKSPLMMLAHEYSVPAGDSLAIDRELFSKAVLELLTKHPNISYHSEEVVSLPQDNVPTIVATGPLTSDRLAEDLVSVIGRDGLAFYDAIAPIIDAESIDFDDAFMQSRWHEGEDGGDYVNCPMSKEIYDAFVGRLLESSKATAHDFEDATFFEGCLPIEVIAERGVDSLRFGPFKPVGLTDPKTGKRPYAVLQLRKEDRFGQSYNLVGCQTRMRIPEQLEAFRLIPALKNVQFLRYGSIHRNTYIDAPRILDGNFRVVAAQSPTFLAGQITGVEGYVESMAVGLMVAHFVLGILRGHQVRFPATSALGGLYAHVLGTIAADTKAKYVPSNVTWAMVPPLEQTGRIGRQQKREQLFERGLTSIRELLENEYFSVHKLV